MNGTMLQAFEWHTAEDGSHWTRLYRDSRRFRWLGITSLWLPPATKGAAGSRDVGYGVYDLYDLGEFDQKGSVRTKYGTREEFIRLVRRLNRMGLHPLCDTVLNHRMGGDEKETVTARRMEWTDRNRPAGDPAEITIWSRFTFPGRKGRYSRFTMDHTCFTGTDDSGGRESGIYLFEGKQWAPDVDGENGNYDFLMGLDVDVRDPEVKRELIRWGTWFLDTTHTFGFRLDAVKHISAAFYREWLEAVRAHAGREVYAVGEYWSYSTDSLMKYLEATGDSVSLFDVPLHGHLREASASDGEYDMRNLFRDTLLERRNNRAVTFADNHDTQPGQSLESWVLDWFKPAAYGLLLLRSVGYPCVFWGDLEGIPAQGIPGVRELPLLLRLRKYHALGTENTWFDDPDLIGLTREGDEAVPDSGVAFVCTNRRGGSKRMYAGKRHAGERWRCVMGGQRPAVIDSEGWGEFSCADGGAACYVPEISLQGLLWRLKNDILEQLRL